jgi:hypothetical protein
MKKTRGMQPASAVFIAILLPVAAYGLVVVMTERAFPGTAIPEGREKRGAVAIRDNVTPFQKWGTRQFTYPYLSQNYDKTWYFTQSEAENRKTAFLSGLDAALKQYPSVDVFLLAHSNQYVEWVADLPADRRRHLRLIYNTGCNDLQQGPKWVELGAKAYVGHPGESASPLFHFYFLRRWIRGEKLKDTMDESNRLMKTALARGQVFSLGYLDAERVSQASEAFCYGSGAFRIQDSQVKPKQP